MLLPTSDYATEYVETLPVFDRAGNRIEGNFKLVYRFRWEDDGATDVAFVCDAKGNLYAVQVVRTNAVLSQPFVLADAAIQVLGNLAIEANKDKMSPRERKLVQSFVDNADAHGLLEWSLRFQQLVGK